MQWYASVPYDLPAQLSHNLLRLDRAAGGLLRPNLSPQVAAALEEASLFDRLRLGLPGAAQDVLKERQRLRALAVGALAVARSYNALLGSLSAGDRRLCRDRLRWGSGRGSANACRHACSPAHACLLVSQHTLSPIPRRALDRRVLPGTNKLSWASPLHQAAFYLADTLAACKVGAAAVAELQAGSAAVADAAALFQGALLVRVERKRLFDLAEFQERQAAHQVGAGGLGGGKAEGSARWLEGCRCLPTD